MHELKWFLLSNAFQGSLWKSNWLECQKATGVERPSANFAKFIALEPVINASPTTTVVLGETINLPELKTLQEKPYWI